MAGPCIYYHCRWPAETGGELVNLQHVNSLHRLGWRAVALFDDASGPLPAALAQAPYMERWDAARVFADDDVLVLPEICHPDTWAKLAQQSGRKVMHNQNPYYTFNGFSDMAQLDAYGFLGAMCCSEFTRQTLRGWGSQLDWQVVPPYLPPAFSRQREKAMPRLQQIAVMPRKRPEEAHLLRNIFHCLFPDWRHVPWVTIEKMSRTDVARVMACSEVFVSLSRFEGLGLPPLEAMASGCLVVGYTGGGGLEYATAENGLWTPEGDLQVLACAIAELLDRSEADKERMRCAAATTAAAYNGTRFDAALIQAWQVILGTGSGRYRLK